MVGRHLIADVFLPLEYNHDSTDIISSWELARRIGRLIQESGFTGNATNGLLNRKLYVIIFESVISFGMLVVSVH